MKDSDKLPDAQSSKSFGFSDRSSQMKRLLRYFLLVVLLSVPFYVAGFALERYAGLLPINLPVSALAAFVPMATALILVSRESGRRGVKRLLASSVSYSRGKGGWCLTAIILMPVVLTLE